MGALVMNGVSILPSRNFAQAPLAANAWKLGWACAPCSVDCADGGRSGGGDLGIVVVPFLLSTFFFPALLLLQMFGVFAVDVVRWHAPFGAFGIGKPAHSQLLAHRIHFALVLLGWSERSGRGWSDWLRWRLLTGFVRFDPGVQISSSCQPTPLDASRGERSRTTCSLQRPLACRNGIDHVYPIVDLILARQVEQLDQVRGQRFGERSQGIRRFEGATSFDHGHQVPAQGSVGKRVACVER